MRTYYKHGKTCGSLYSFKSIMDDIYYLEDNNVILKQSYYKELYNICKDVNEMRKFRISESIDVLNIEQETIAKLKEHMETKPEIVKQIKANEAKLKKLYKLVNMRLERYEK